MYISNHLAMLLFGFGLRSVYVTDHSTKLQDSVGRTEPASFTLAR